MFSDVFFLTILQIRLQQGFNQQRKRVAARMRHGDLPGGARPRKLAPNNSESSPQRTSDDLPLPDVSTTATNRLLPKLWSSSIVCSSRPKKR